MVAVTAPDALASQTPLSVSPAVKGRFRWLGAATLLFQPDGERFPMATEYTLEVPAGTRAAAGTTLPASVRFRFATPAPTVEEFHPASGPVRRDAIMFARFDQRIDPE